MAVTLYKPGNTREINGIKCDIENFDEYSYLHMLTMGWFYSPEECYSIPKEKEFFTPDGTLEVEELTEEEIRADAKSKKIRNWHNKKIDKLKLEIEAWRPEI